MHVTPIRRKYLLRLLAQIDQQIAEGKSLAHSRLLTTDERSVAAAYLSESCEALNRVENMLLSIEWSG